MTLGKLTLFLIFFSLNTLSFSLLASDSLQTGVAITDIKILRKVENQFGIGRFFKQSPDQRIDNKTLSLTVFKDIIQTVDSDIKDYIQKNPDAGIGMRFPQRVFDLNYLQSSRARFVLVGIVNRMDRTYVTPKTCGEVRFIYRLSYNVDDQGQTVASRLPMTINVVANAKKENDTQIDCSQLAQKWLNLKETVTSEDLESLLSSYDIQTLSRVEINLQLARIPSAVRPDFGGSAAYLLRVFKFNQNNQSLKPVYLENQIDRQKLISDENLKLKFKSWIKNNLKDLDRGMVVVPDEFLATKALSVSPGGMARSANRQMYGVVTTAELEKLDYSGLALIKSPKGLYRRLNDMSCTGCHQTRAIGGFHFMGQDPNNLYPGNSVYSPASAHFFGDLPRRKDILNSLAAKSTPDFSRGFSDRPQIERSPELKNTGLYNGWGAHCSVSGKDPSFIKDTCAKGYICKSFFITKLESDAGICVSDKGPQIGEPLEVGFIETISFGNDRLKVAEKIKAPLRPLNYYVASPQSGGFSGGNLRTNQCKDLPSYASCGALPTATPGFNPCLVNNNFLTCIKKHATPVGLRACDEKNSCRDDYICVANEKGSGGVCAPPYFLFQFRIDGHPTF